MFIEVLIQIIVLMILISVGFIFGKLKILSGAAASAMTELVLWVATPCVIIKSFVRKFDPSQLKDFGLIVVITVVMHLFFILVSRLCFRKSEQGAKRVLQCAMIFSNCGYMALPLQQSLLGDDGVFYCSAFIAVFNLITWSYGIYLMSGDKKYITVKKFLVNPGMIGIAVGLVIFLFSIPLPKVLYDPISHFAALNTPLPMIIIGYHLANSDLVKVIKDTRVLLGVAFRLVIFPLISIFALYLCSVRGNLLVSLTISSCAPSATITTMFSSKFNDDTPLSAGMVSLCTLVSICTMPPIITLAQTLS